VGEEEGGGEEGRGRGWELDVGASGICGGGRSGGRRVLGSFVRVGC